MLHDWNQLFRIYFNFREKLTMRAFKVLFVKELSLIFTILRMCDLRAKHDNSSLRTHCISWRWNINNFYLHAARAW